MNSALCDWNTVQGMTITQVFFTQSSSCTVHLLVQISQSRLLKLHVNNGYVCLLARLKLKKKNYI